MSLDVSARSSDSVAVDAPGVDAVLTFAMRSPGTSPRQGIGFRTIAFFD